MKSNLFVKQPSGTLNLGGRFSMYITTLPLCSFISFFKPNFFIFLLPKILSKIFNRIKWYKYKKENEQTPNNPGFGIGWCKKMNKQDNCLESNYTGAGYIQHYFFYGLHALISYPVAADVAAVVATEAATA